MKKLSIFLGALAAMMLSPAAHAAQFVVNLNDSLGEVAINALVTTSDTFTIGDDGREGLAITGISGTRNGTRITGLSGAFNSFTFDNRIYPDQIFEGTDLLGRALTETGVGFSVAGTDSIFNLFLSEVFRFPELPFDVGFYSERELLANGSTVTRELSAGTIAAVPEPGIWAMMILGFGVIGGALRRERRRTRGAVPAHA